MFKDDLWVVSSLRTAAEVVSWNRVETPTPLK